MSIKAENRCRFWIRYLINWSMTLICDQILSMTREQCVNFAQLKCTHTQAHATISKRKPEQQPLVRNERKPKNTVHRLEAMEKEKKMYRLSMQRRKKKNKSSQPWNAIQCFRTTSFYLYTKPKTHRFSIFIDVRLFLYLSKGLVVFGYESEDKLFISFFFGLKFLMIK